MRVPYVSLYESDLPDTEEVRKIKDSIQLIIDEKYAFLKKIEKPLNTLANGNLEKDKELFFESLVIINEELDKYIIRQLEIKPILARYEHKMAKLFFQKGSKKLSEIFDILDNDKFVNLRKGGDTFAQKYTDKKVRDEKLDYVLDEWYLPSIIQRLSKAFSETDKGLYEVSKTFKNTFGFLKSRVPEKQELTYLGVPITIFLGKEKEKFTDKDIKTTIEIIRVGLDKLAQEKFSSLFKELHIVVLTADQYNLSYGKSAHNSYAYYMKGDKTIYMPIRKYSGDDSYFLKTFYHEFGHHVHRYAMKDKWETFHKRLLKLHKKGKFKFPTKYAETDSEESFAEIFAFIMMPNNAHAEIPQDVVRVFKNLIYQQHGIKFKEEFENGQI